MFVIKRDGTQESVKFDKITARVQKLSYGLDPAFVDPIQVAKKVIEEANDIIIELFQEEELQYNITKHYLVPKHELAHSKGTKGATLRAT